ncbi:MAG: hypothetical protein ACYCX4_13865 [Bacillota bacterium]
MGKIYTFYSPQRGAGLTTLLFRIADWLTGHTELTVALFNFSNRPENAYALTGNQVTTATLLSDAVVPFDPKRPVTFGDLQAEQKDTFAALQKASALFDLVFVDLSNRLDRIGHQVLDLSHRIILVTPGTELVVRYFQKMLDLSRVLERKEAKQVDLLLSRVRNEDEISVLTEEIKNHMVGFVLDRQDEESLKRVADDFYYDFYLQKLSDQRREHFEQAINNFVKQLDNINPQTLVDQLWKAIQELELPYNKRVLLFRWLVFRSRLGQTFPEAAAELIPRFISDDFINLARDMAIENESLGALIGPPAKSSNVTAS